MNKNSLSIRPTLIITFENETLLPSLPPALYFRLII